MRKNIHALVAGTRTINLSLLRLVKQLNPLFVAHGYAYISVEEGCRYNPSRRNISWPVLYHMAMRPQDSPKSSGPDTIKHIKTLYSQALTARKTNFARVQVILLHKLSDLLCLA
jgi:hypothetical protein